MLTGAMGNYLQGNLVFTTKDTFTGKIIVGADGSLPTVAHYCGMNKPHQLAIAIKCEVLGDFEDD